MRKISVFIKKISKNIKMMRLYGAEPMIGAHLETLTSKLFGFNNWYIRHRHQRVISKLIPSHENIKNKFSSDDHYKPISPDCKIWFMWWQGTNHYPDAVRIALSSIKKHSDHHEIVELSEDNILTYIDIPADIQEMFAQKKISITHYSDIIRFTLLSKYGGIWMDSTMLLTDSFPDEFYNHSLYTIKRKRVNNTYISAGRWSTYFMACGPDNIFPCYCRDFLINYWRCNKRLVDYTMLDYAIHIGYEYVPAIKKQLDSIDYNNTNTTKLYELLNKPFDKNIYEEMLCDTYLFKLSWKEAYSKSINGQETFFGHIGREELL